LATKMKKKNSFLRDLGDGLILRRSTVEDAEALAAFNSQIHGDEETKEPNENIGVWVRDLLERPHPTYNVDDFTIVEDTNTGTIVSSLNLISQTWSYEGIEFNVGRPELVGTLPEYRHRGLVRAQFEVIHKWSAERGELVQVITGIPFYYRQFGYEMSLNLGGGRLGYLPLVPKLKDGEKEAYSFRSATLEDLHLISKLYERGCERSMVSCKRDQDMWRYEIAGKSPDNVNRFEVVLIEDASGEPVGYLAHPPYNWAKGVTLVVTSIELKRDVSWAAVAPSVIRYLKATGEAYATKEGKEPFGAFGFWLGAQHPIYEVISDRLPREREPYAWYLRIPSMLAFLRHITPVLENRLSKSPIAGHTGELQITFYRNGLKFTFESGNITGIEEWKPSPNGYSGGAAFPGLSFLQMIFGYRCFDELEHAFADCWWDNDEARVLLNALFPKRASNVWPVA